MKIYGASEAAVELGVEPRALRRWLRNNPSYRNAGIGGRYMFQQHDIDLMRRQLKHDGVAVQGFVPLKTKDPALLDGEPGCPLDKLLVAQGDRASLERLRVDRREARAGRQQRLRTRMNQVLPDRYDDEMPEDYYHRVGWR